MKKVLIWGCTGQDGSYLSELLLEKGYEVHGVKRRSSSYNTNRLDHIYDNENFHLHYGDITDSLNVTALIKKIQPDEIYNLAAQSHVMVSFEIPEYTANVDAIGTLRILEAIRLLGVEKTTKVYQASTSELFGLVQEIPQKETTPFYPRSPYGVAKLYGYWIIKNYREAYDMFACQGLLFNHETVSGIMPMIFKEGNSEEIDIKSIAEIVKYHTNSGKVSIDESLETYQETEVHNDLYVWDSIGFTKVKFASGYPHDIENNNKSPRYLISKNAAYLATGNHVCIMDGGIEKEFKDINIGDEINVIDYPSNVQNTILSTDEAELIGFIVGDGNRTRNSVKYVGKNVHVLEHYATIWENLGGTVTKYMGFSGFTGKKDIHQYILNGIKPWVHENLSDIYDENKKKRVPKNILNSSKDIQLAFLIGYNAADGLKSNLCVYEFKNFKTNSPTLASGLLYLLHSTTQQKYNINVEYGFSHGKFRTYYSINILSNSTCGQNHKNSINSYNLIQSEFIGKNIPQRKFSKDSGIGRKFISKVVHGYIPDNTHHFDTPNNKIKKIIDLPEYDGWFYDLETESSTFHCGIGQGHVHNSPRRGETFVTQKIVMGLNAIKNKKSDVLYLGNINSLRDWGHAQDYVEAMWLMLQQEKPDDFVIATGEQYSVKQFVEFCAPYFGMNIRWHGTGLMEQGVDIISGNVVVEVDPKYFRPTEVATLLGDSTKARTILGWKPKHTFEDLVEDMCLGELKRNPR